MHGRRLVSEYRRAAWRPQKYQLRAGECIVAQYSRPPLPQELPHGGLADGGGRGARERP